MWFQSRFFFQNAGSSSSRPKIAEKETESTDTVRDKTASSSEVPAPKSKADNFSLKVFIMDVYFNNEPFSVLEVWNMGGISTKSFQPNRTANTAPILQPSDAFL